LAIIRLHLLQGPVSLPLDPFCHRAHQFVIEGESYRKRPATGSSGFCDRGAPLRRKAPVPKTAGNRVFLGGHRSSGPVRSPMPVGMYIPAILLREAFREGVKSKIAPSPISPSGLRRVSRPSGPPCAAISIRRCFPKLPRSVPFSACSMCSSRSPISWGSPPLSPHGTRQAGLVLRFGSPRLSFIRGTLGPGSRAKRSAGSARLR